MEETKTLYTLIREVHHKRTARNPKRKTCIKHIVARGTDYYAVLKVAEEISDKYVKYIVAKDYVVNI